MKVKQGGAPHPGRSSTYNHRHGPEIDRAANGNKRRQRGEDQTVSERGSLDQDARLTQRPWQIATLSTLSQSPGSLTIWTYSIATVSSMGNRDI